jgi:hypothetical protein
MAAQDKVTFKQDLTEPVKIRHYEGVVFTGDDCGNLIKVALFDGGTPYSGGGTVSATAILADGTTSPLTQGSITGNMVSVPLEAGALAVSGLMGLYVKISGDGIICTVLNAIFTVQATDTGMVPAAMVTTVNELVQEIKDAQDSFPADLTNLLAAVAPTFSTSTAYSAGAYVWQGGKLYRFTAAHPAGTWTGTDAAAVALGNDVSDLKSVVNYYNDLIYYGKPAKNAVVFDNSDVSPGDTITYDMDVNWTGAAAFLDILDTDGNRIVYIGKGSSSAGNMHYSGQYYIPDNFGSAVFTTTSSAQGALTINYITKGIRAETVANDFYGVNKNWYDPASITKGKGYNQSGTAQNNASIFYTGKINVAAFKRVCVVNGLEENSRFAICFFNVKNGFVSSVLQDQTGAVQTVDIPDGAEYMIANGLLVNKDSLRVYLTDGNVAVKNEVFCNDASPNNGTLLFTHNELNGIKTLYYDIYGVYGKVGYVSLHTADSAVNIGKTASANTTQLRTIGSVQIPVGFTYAEWITNDAGNRINYLASFQMGSLENKDAEPTQNIQQNYVDAVCQINAKIASESTGADATFAYGFSARNIYLPAGKTLHIKTNPDYCITALVTYNEFGVYSGVVHPDRSSDYYYTATATQWIAANIVAFDTSVTFDNNFVELSGLEVNTDYQNEIRQNSGKLLSRTYIYPDSNTRYCRIPEVEVMPNNKTLCLFDSRATVYDDSETYISYCIVNSQNEIEKTGILEEKASNVHRQNESMAFTKPNGDIAVFFTNILSDGETELHYILSTDYGNTWGTSVIIDATETGEQLFVAPSTKPVFVGENTILVPIWKRDKTDTVGTTYQSGLMLFNYSDLTHTEKYVPSTDYPNECNVWLNSDKTKALLSCRLEAKAQRKFYSIDVGLTGEFTLCSNFRNVSSWARNQCEEGVFQTGDTLYISRQANTYQRNKLVLYASDSYGRKDTEILDLSNGYANSGYSCIDVKYNLITIFSEGNDKTIGTNGKCLFLDRIIV